MGWNSLITVLECLCVILFLLCLFSASIHLILLMYCWNKHLLKNYCNSVTEICHLSSNTANAMWSNYTKTIHSTFHYIPNLHGNIICLITCLNLIGVGNVSLLYSQGLTCTIGRPSCSSCSEVWIRARASVSCHASLRTKCRVRPFLPFLSMAVLGTAYPTPPDYLAHARLNVYSFKTSSSTPIW